VSFPRQKFLTEFLEKADFPYCLGRQYWANDDATPVTIPLSSAKYFEHCLCLVRHENLVGWLQDRMGKDSLGLNFFRTESLNSQSERKGHPVNDLDGYDAMIKCSGKLSDRMMPMNTNRPAPPALVSCRAWFQQTARTRRQQ
jgi:hypothetical protein